jgi:hypothetical protein
MNFCFGLEDLLETAIFTLAAAELVTAGQLTQHHAVYSVQKQYRLYINSLRNPQII